MSEPFAVSRGEPPRLETPTGSDAWVMARASNTGGALSVVELLNLPHDGPATHIHTREDEIWYVLDGEYRFKTGDSIVTLTTGGLAYGPRGLPHAFQNVAATPGRLLIITAPAGLEHFFESYHPDDPTSLTTASATAGITFTAPPLAVTNPLP
jgi:mannose-6-phosphate isomerase-like protein (cupin superfamily)